MIIEVLDELIYNSNNYIDYQLYNKDILIAIKCIDYKILNTQIITEKNNFFKINNSIIFIDFNKPNIDNIVKENNLYLYKVYSSYIDLSKYFDGDYDYSNVIDSKNSIKLSLNGDEFYGYAVSKYNDKNLIEFELSDYSAFIQNRYYSIEAIHFDEGIIYSNIIYEYPYNSRMKNEINKLIYMLKYNGYY